ncbi:hypothetical protein CUT44_24905 [Streptomyces carminius]|uniref:Chaplin domain-containing protein n=1 Tax=Streptomyces carminius TaxID=2665496 RepID=A0A2M8LSH9_9ACTN|nr:chaplin [Streptomyces carminius]PJE94920.1 hypothetical protein CUT44_24905 [Streptomyces carminius]
MRQVTRKGLITIAAAGGVLALSGGHAHADASAEGAAIGSSGVLSGNTVQMPVHGPANICGNTVSAVGALNSAYGNECANLGHGQRTESHRYDGGHRHAEGTGHTGDATARGVARGSDGLLDIGSGNVVQAPVKGPANICGNSVTAGGGLNSAFGNDCVNEGSVPEPVTGTPEAPEKPEAPEEPREQDCEEEPEPKPEHEHKKDKPADKEREREQDEKQEPAAEAPGRDDDSRDVQVPVKGSLAETGAPALGMVLPASAGALLGGAVLYRRARAARN